MPDMGDMEETLKQKLEVCGQRVKIYPLTKIVNPEVIEIGDCSMIDE